MVAEYSMIVLLHDRPVEGLLAGDVGAVVHVYENGRAYEVEFVDGAGTTIALLTLPADEVRPIAAGELLHARRRS